MKSIGLPLAVLVVLAISCATPDSSMLDYSQLRSAYAGQFFAHDRILVLRVENPLGVSVVPYEPTLESGRVVLVAGVVSSGGPGERLHCFDIGALSPPEDWRDLLFWRQRDGGLVRIDAEHGEEARRLTRRCS